MTWGSNYDKLATAVCMYWEPFLYKKVSHDSI